MLIIDEHFKRSITHRNANRNRKQEETLEIMWIIKNKAIKFLLIYIFSYFFLQIWSLKFFFSLFWLTNFSVYFGFVTQLIFTETEINLMHVSIEIRDLQTAVRDWKYRTVVQMIFVGQNVTYQLPRKKVRFKFFERCQ